MTPYSTAILPIEGINREQHLMNLLIDHRQIDLKVDPLQEVLRLLGSLGEVSSALNCLDDDVKRSASDQTVHADLYALLVIAAGLARQFDVVPYDNDEWPDGVHVRIGGDGAVAEGHDPHRLMNELLEAAGWVATWVQGNLGSAGHTTTLPSSVPTWLAAEPITELIARTWCLADRLDARDQLLKLIHENLPGHLPASAT